MSACMDYCRLALLLAFLAEGTAEAEFTVPIVSAPLPAQSLAPHGKTTSIDLQNHFVLPGVTGPVVQLDTVMGKFNVELFAETPATRANFLNYVTQGRYDNTLIHRAVPGFVLQGGGYAINARAIPADPPIPNEFSRSNLRGTVAMARFGVDPDSATSEWFINLTDNSAPLDQQNGGFTVFARVLGTGMKIADAIAALPTSEVMFPADLLLEDMPVRNLTPGQTQLEAANLVTLRSATLVPIYPGSETGGAVLEFTVASSNPAVVTAELAGSTLTLTARDRGTARVVVRATDTNGNTVEDTFAVAVAPEPPVFTLQANSQTIASGTTVAFVVKAPDAASFQWQHNGVALAGANRATLLVRQVAEAHAGAYTCLATNAGGTTLSAAAMLTVTPFAPADIGRLANFSVLTRIGAGADTLILGAVIGGGDTHGAIPLVIRALGPALAGPPFNVPGVLENPVIALHESGTAAPVDANDDWGGDAELTALFNRIGAFPLRADSRDSALWHDAVVPADRAGRAFTVTITSAGEAIGTALAEIHDATDTRTATTPRLINLSTLAPLAPGADLSAEFVLRGDSARTLLVRGVGPTLGALFGLSNVLADPAIALYDSLTGRRVAENNDWADEDDSLALIAALVGAFPLAGVVAKDAALVVTLAPGLYRARLNGADGGGGTALIEIYEIP